MWSEIVKLGFPTNAAIDGGCYQCESGFQSKAQIRAATLLQISVPLHGLVVTEAFLRFRYGSPADPTQNEFMPELIRGG